MLGVIGQEMNIRGVLFVVEVSVCVCAIGLCFNLLSASVGGPVRCGDVDDGDGDLL